jgi:hypothetical protein
MRATALLLFVVVAATAAFEGVRMRDIETLTFEVGALTAAQRTVAIPQLQCVGDAALCHAYAPANVQCVNTGAASDTVVNWRCEAELASRVVQLATVHIDCEGFSRPDDPVVLVGSCALRYTLMRSPGGWAGDDSIADKEFLVFVTVFMSAITFLTLVILLLALSSRAELPDVAAPSNAVIPVSSPPPCYHHRRRHSYDACNGFAEGILFATIMSSGGGGGGRSTSSGGDSSKSSAFGTSSSR